MPPSKLRNNHEDTKSETPSNRDKNGHSTAAQHPNGKARRIVSATGFAPLATSQAAPTQMTQRERAEMEAIDLKWDEFDREYLHEYQRVHQLETPSSFSAENHRMVLTQPGGIGLQSPTMARRKDLRRQGKFDLQKTVRKHSNGLGIQENDVVVDFLHKVRTQGVTKPSRIRKSESHEETSR